MLSDEDDFPHLAIETAYQGIKSTIKISTRDGKATLTEGSYDVAIQTSNTVDRRLLAESEQIGQCLANGACLYSKDELVRLSQTSRRLMESYFEANADIATYVRVWDSANPPPACPPARHCPRPTVLPPR